MNEILNSYINACLHPWLTHDLLNLRRKQNKVKRETPALEIVGDEDTLTDRVAPKVEKVEKEEKVGVTFQESMSISWIFSIFHATYSIIGITMGLNSVDWAQEELSYVMDSASAGLMAYSIFSLLLNVVLFPLYFWLYGRFWINILKVFSNIFEREDNEDEIASRCEEIVANSFSSYTFLVIPIVGDFLHKFSFLIYLYAGLRRNLKLNLLQSILVLLCPLILILLALFLMVMSFGLLIATL